MGKIKKTFHELADNLYEATWGEMFLLVALVLVAFLAEGVAETVADIAIWLFIVGELVATYRNWRASKK